MTLFKKIFSKQNRYNLCVVWDVFIFSVFFAALFEEPDPMLEWHYKAICDSAFYRCMIPLEGIVLFLGVTTFIALILPDKHHKGKRFFILLPVIYSLLAVIDTLFFMPDI